MMRYIRKKLIINAFKFGYDITPSWFTDLQKTGDITQIFINEKTKQKMVLIITPEGPLECKEGYYVIKDERDRVYPLKEQIFLRTYERYRGK